MADDENWREQLPEDIRNDTALAPIQDVGSLAKSFIHAQKMIGKDKIVIPDDQASEEERADFYTKLGRPATAEDYEVSQPDNLPEGFPLNEQIQKSFKTEAHKLGLTPGQVGGLYNWFMGSQVEAWNNGMRASDDAAAVSEQQLRSDWGQAFDTKVGQVENMIRAFGDEKLQQYLKDTGINNNVLFIRFLGSVAENLSEDSMKGLGRSTFDVMTPEAAQQKIKELRGDKAFMESYQSKKDPGHQGAVEKMTRLYGFAYPETSDK